MCGARSVTKAPMAPRSIRSAGERSAADNRARQVAHQILESIGKLREQVEKSSEYVGGEFAEEARRIHYGETEERGIRGEASDDEVQELEEEDIGIYRLPNLPRSDA